MPINRKSRRRMSPLARRVAELHNDAAALSRKLKILAEDIALFEAGTSKKFLDEFELPKKEKPSDAGESVRAVRLAQKIGRSGL
jgi:hypothetical protein